MTKTVTSDKVFLQVAQQLQELLVSTAGQKTLLLLSGGSAVKVYKELADQLISGPVTRSPRSDVLAPSVRVRAVERGPQRVPPVIYNFPNLTVGLIDERYDPDPQHEGSNAVAIEKAGLFERLRSRGARVETILHGKSMDEEVKSYNIFLENLLTTNYSLLTTIAIFGIGKDGHTAGIFPTQTIEEFRGIYRSLPTACLPARQGEAGLEDEVLVVGHHYGAEPYKDRITITPLLISKLDHAFLVTQGEGKKKVLQRFSNASFEDRYQIPAVVLKSAKNLMIFTDRTL